VKADLSPTGRALRALELLQAQPGITGGQLAAQLDVTERAARRYITILREAGIPVESTRGPYGGYRVGRGIRLPPLVFTATEALGLVMAVLDGSHAASDADDPVVAALGKIIRVLPENVGRPAATMRRYACAAPDRGAVHPGTQTTSALVDAIAAQRRVSIGYRSQSGRQWAEDVDPWASSSGMAAGTCCATRIAPARSAPTASTGSSPSPEAPGSSAHPGTWTT
jgi:predicted DNA-binding transcriptional regulator YafY